MINRFRFSTPHADYRPSIFNPAYPWWKSGSNSDGDAIIIAFLPDHEDIHTYWQERADESVEQYEKIFFTSRFPMPKYFQALENKPDYETHS